MQLHPDLDPVLAVQLATIWDEVLDMVIDELFELTKYIIPNIHINLKEEMVLELVNLRAFLGRTIVKKQLSGRIPSSINISDERVNCLSELGLKKIKHTAEGAAKHVWLKKYNERWLPKSARLLAKENKPLKKKKLKVVEVNNNHFIPKFLIKRFWSEDGKIWLFKKSDIGLDKVKILPFGQWGFLQKLYTHRLEAYFGLIEGDAVRPISMLLNVEPMNRPQKEALVGFIVIQHIRNPFYIEDHHKIMAPIIKKFVGETKSRDKQYMQMVYEGIYANNEIYEKLARPFFDNKWVVVSSNSPQFILPDTCNIFGGFNGSNYIIAPISTTKCLVIIPIKKIYSIDIPYYIEEKEQITRDLLALLFLHARREFIAPCGFTQKSQIRSDSEEIIHRLIYNLTIITNRRDKEST